MTSESHGYGFPLWFISTTIFVALFCISYSAFAQENYRFQRMWPTLKQPWYFLHPYDLTIDREGFIYIADSDNNRVRKFTANGQFVVDWGGKGAGEGQFEVVSGIAADPYGFLYAVDIGNHRIQKFTPDGQFVMQWGGKGETEGRFNSPYGICADKNGFIYVTDIENHRIQKFTAEGVFVTQWTGNGKTPEPFSPLGIAAGQQGNIYVADTNNDRIHRFTPEGEFLGHWGDTGDGNGQFRNPDGIAIDSSGYVYVTDIFNHRIQKFTGQGEFVAKWGAEGTGIGQFNHPAGMAPDRNGYLYVADRENNRIKKYTTDGRAVSVWGTASGNGEFNMPKGIAYDVAAGQVLVADTKNHRIQRFSADGEFIDSWGENGSEPGQFDAPEGIIVGPNGRIYVADSDNSRIQVFDASGGFEHQFGSYGAGMGEFQSPYAVAVAENGTIYVAEYGNHRIQAFSSTGHWLFSWGKWGKGHSEFKVPQGITIDSTGNVFVADTGNHRIQRFDATGRWLGIWGKQGHAAGELNFPFGIAADRQGNLFVADADNHRIQKFTPTGKLIALWGERGYAPGQFQYPGDVAIAPDGRVFVADTDNHRIQIFGSAGDEMFQKAVIVAGGGPYPGNRLWDATQVCAGFAHRVMIQQGIPKDSIRYMTHDIDLDLDGNGEPDDVYATPSREALRKSISHWAADADRLIVYLADHGGKRAFRLSESQILTASDLDEMLDLGPKEVILIYDACNAGSILPELDAPEGQSRVLVTSTSEGEDAYFITQGAISFSNFFWTSIFNGNDLQTAFEHAQGAIAQALDFQHPMIESQGEIDPEDVYIGFGNLISAAGPTISKVSPNQILSDGPSAKIFAAVTDEDGIDRVWAVIRPPFDPNHSPDNPVIELPSVNLLQTAADRYEAVYDGFQLRGTYDVAIYARDGKGDSSLPKITKVSVETPAARRSLIVVGDVEGPHGKAIQSNAQAAYNALKNQGYPDADILFLSPVTFSTGVDGLATADAVESAILSADGVQDLVLYLIGHNDSDASFALNSTSKIMAEDLDRWLDQFQREMAGPVTVICDFGYSGSFLPLLSPEEGQNRLLISGTSAHQHDFFPADGTLSFSGIFWSQVLNGESVGRAFEGARDALSLFLGARADMGPQLDDNGNGIGNERSDGHLADLLTIGAGIRTARNDPVVNGISPEMVLNGETAALLRVEGISLTGEIDRVWAAVTRPGREDDFFEEVDQETVDLTPAAAGGFSGVYDGFDRYGTYTITYYASDGEGNVSAGKTGTVLQTQWPDVYEQDNSADAAGDILLNGGRPQCRNFHAAGDEDWVRFPAVSGEIYTILIDEQGEQCRAVVEIYDGKYQLLGTRETDLSGNPLRWDWRSDQDGMIYVRVRDLDPKTFGPGADYRLDIFRPIGPLLGFIKGIVTDESTQSGIGNAWITTDTRASAMTRSDGRYVLVHAPGEFDLTLVAEGYGSALFSDVRVSEAGTTIQNAVLKSTGPIDPDGDGISGETDLCPGDPNKTVPGICGCGVPDADRDQDRVPDCNDECPDDPDKTDPGICGCGKADSDEDGDGVLDCEDQCPDDPQKSFPGDCGCGIPDNDADDDGISDCLKTDLCPEDPDKIHPWICGCGTPDTDRDGDGVPDCRDACPDDPEKIEAGYCGCGIPDHDSDEDGIPDCEDTPPDTPLLSGPEDGGRLFDLTPVLSADSFHDPDADDFHSASQWQISHAVDFSSLAMDITHSHFLTRFPVPPLLLKAEKHYHWQVRFFDSRGEVSAWSSAYSFSTAGIAEEDADSDGVSDAQETGADLDLDLDGVPDALQPGFITFYTQVAAYQAGLRCLQEGWHIETVKSGQTGYLPEIGNFPQTMPLGVIHFRLLTDIPGQRGKVELYFSNPLPAQTEGYLYDPSQGWKEYGGDGIFKKKRTCFEMEVQDGGMGDIDGVANGVVINTTGFGIGKSEQETISKIEDSGDVGGFGCFIQDIEKMNF